MEKYPEKELEIVYRKSVLSVWDKLKVLWNHYGPDFLDEISGVVDQYTIPEGQMEEYVEFSTLGAGVQLDFLRHIERTQKIDLDTIDMNQYCKPSDRYNYDED